MNKNNKIYHNRDDIMVNKYSPSVIYQCTDAGWDVIINYSSAPIPVIVLLRTQDNGTNMMRKQKYDTERSKGVTG